MALDEGTPSIEASVVAGTYEVELEDFAGAGNAIEAFNAADRVVVNVIRKGKTREIDVKSCVSNLAILDGNVLSLSLSYGAPTLKISEAVAAITGMSAEEMLQLRAKKVGVQFRNPRCQIPDAR